MINPAEVMATHQPCATGHDRPLCHSLSHAGQGSQNWPCEPYRLAEALVHAEAERGRATQVERSRNGENVKPMRRQIDRLAAENAALREQMQRDAERMLALLLNPTMDVGERLVAARQVCRAALDGSA